MSASSGKQFTVSEVIDSFGINSHTWLMFVLLGLANIFDGYDFMVVNSTNSYLAASFGVSALVLTCNFLISSAHPINLSKSPEILAGAVAIASP